MKKLLLLLVTMFFIIQCGQKSEKNDSFEEMGLLDQLSLLLLFTPSSPTPPTPLRTVSDGSRCGIWGVQCSASSVCLPGSYYDPLLFSAICVRVPPVTDTILVNGPSKSGTIVTDKPIVDFDVPISHAGKYLFLLHQVRISLFAALHVLSIDDDRTLQYAKEDQLSGSPVPLVMEISTPATYRLRALSYRAFSNFRFGGEVHAQVLSLQEPIPTSGSCNLFTNSTLSHCLYYVQSSSYAASSCDGTYNASQTCAEVNSGRSPTKVGSCLYSERNKPGEGGIVLNYYSHGTGIVAPANSTTARADCNTRSPSIYQ